MNSIGTLYKAFKKNGAAYMIFQLEDIQLLLLGDFWNDSSTISLKGNICINENDLIPSYTRIGYYKYSHSEDSFRLSIFKLGLFKTSIISQDIYHVHQYKFANALEQLSNKAIIETQIPPGSKFQKFLDRYVLVDKTLKITFQLKNVKAITHSSQVVKFIVKTDQNIYISFLSSNMEDLVTELSDESYEIQEGIYLSPNFDESREFTFIYSLERSSKNT